MAIEAITAIGAIDPAESVKAASQAAPAAGDFGAWFTQQVGAVNTAVLRSEHDAHKLAVGEVQNLHEVMINMEEAKLSFQLLAQVRNRLLEAYQEVMRMQV